MNRKNKQAMSDKRLSEYLPEYIEGALDEKTHREVSEWLASSESAEAEKEALEMIMGIAKEDEFAEPPIRLGNQFFEELEELALGQNAKASRMVNLKNLFSLDSNIFKLGYTAAILVFGIGIGSIGFNNTGESNQDQLANLAMQVDELKLQVMDSKLSHPSTNQRLQAVRYGYHFQSMQSSTMTRLVKVIESDPNSHVRLAAMQVLLEFIDESDVEKELVRLCLEQNNGVVQMMLLNQLQAWNPKKAKWLSSEIEKRSKLAPVEKTRLNNKI